MVASHAAKHSHTIRYNLAGCIAALYATCAACVYWLHRWHAGLAAAPLKIFIMGAPAFLIMGGKFVAIGGIIEPMMRAGHAAAIA